MASVNSGEEYKVSQRSVWKGVRNGLFHGKEWESGKLLSSWEGEEEVMLDRLKKTKPKTFKLERIVMEWLFGKINLH